MSLWNALTGGKAAQHGIPTTSNSVPDVSSPSTQRHDQPQQTTTFAAAPAPGAPAPAAAAAGGSSILNGGSGSGLGSGLGTGLGSGLGADAFLQSSAFADPTQIHPLAGLNKETLEYITLEDSALSDLPGSQSVLPSRGFTDDLCYGTGITYLAALTLGGAWGLQEGLRRSAGQPPKLRLNSVLNAVTRRGPFLGNSAGVVAIVYNCVNSYIGYVRGRHDAVNSVTAGALSGMLFKSTRGVRPMLISGGIVASVAAAWTVTRRTLFPIPEPGHA